jgi:hypothetical protein
VDGREETQEGAWKSHERPVDGATRRPGAGRDRVEKPGFGPGFEAGSGEVVRHFDAVSRGAKARDRRHGGDALPAVPGVRGSDGDIVDPVTGGRRRHREDLEGPFGAGW